MEKEKRQYFNIWSFAIILLLFVISIFFLFIFMPKSFLPKDTLGIYLTEASYEQRNESEVTIFEEDAFEKKLVHPLVKGSYSFAIYNNSKEENMPYELEFIGENLDDIPIIFSLQRNEKYIFGGKEKNEKRPLKEFDVENIELDGRTTDIYKLEWAWDTVSDEVDTFIGNIAKNQDYHLIIRAKEIESNDIISFDRITRVDDDTIRFKYLDILKYIALIILLILIFYAVHRIIVNINKNVEKKSIKEIARNIIIGILTLVLLVNIINVFNGVILKKQVSTVFGYGGAMVLTGSMEPVIKPGDLIIMKKQNEYNKGDIITYRGENKSITHRIVDITENGFIVTGDANNVEDGEISKDLIIGKVIKTLPGFDNVLKVVNHPLVVIIPIVIFIILYKLLPCIRARRENPDSEISDCLAGEDKAPIVRYLLYLIILTTIVSSVSYASFIDSVETSSKARVANFDVEITHNTWSVSKDHDFALLESGEIRSFSFEITNKSEVAIKARMLNSADNSLVDTGIFDIYDSDYELIEVNSNGWFILGINKSCVMEASVKTIDFLNELEFYFEYEQID